MADRYRLLTIVLLGFMVIIRFWMLGAYPLLDTTEARYAEIGRKMLELNDWITPWFDYQVAFWGKPPLSFWMTALSFKLFGINEFAARLPHFLIGLLNLFIVWKWLCRWSSGLAFNAAAILASSVLFYGSMGLVMTDMWLLFGITLAMTGYWESVAANTARGQVAPWLFFVGIAIGLLAKGPLTLVLVGAPLLFWIIKTKRWKGTWESLPWLRGSLLVGVLVVPWYLLAELKTPGFLDYFVVGEHLHRFLIPGWQGDLYGRAHSEAYGMIWAFLLVGCLPWSVLFFLALARQLTIASEKQQAADEHGLTFYLWSWALTPAVLFTFAGNILSTYMLPALPALAVLAARRISAPDAPLSVLNSRFVLIGVASSVLLFAALFSYLLTTERLPNRTAKFLIDYYQSNSNAETPLVYFMQRPFSASFYSAGKAINIKSPQEIAERLQQGPLFIALQAEHKRLLTPDVQNRLLNGKLFGRFWLYQLKPDAQASSSAPTR